MHEQEFPKQKINLSPAGLERIHQDFYDEFNLCAKNAKGDKALFISGIKDFFVPYQNLLPALFQNMIDQLTPTDVPDNTSLWVRVIKAKLEPVFHYWTDHLEDFEKIQQEQFIRRRNFIEVNKFVSYDLNDDKLRLRLAPNRTTPNKEKLELLRDGLKKIAVFVQGHNEIKVIKGTSWFVKEYPAIIEKLGFKIRHITDIDHENYNGVMVAEMKREDFLEKYSG